MIKRIDKIIQSKTAPESNNVLWDDGKNLKINRNGNWETTIDPVVWKYMCDPLVIKAGESVPEELIGKFNEEEGDRYNLKYPYKNMYVIEYRDNSLINPVNANNIGITIQGYIRGDGNSITYVYDSAWIGDDKKWNMYA